MAESTLGYDDPASPDRYLHSWSRTIGGTAKEGQFVLPEEHVLATYSALAAGIATTTSAAHLICIEADGTNYIRLHRIWVQQVVGAGSATLAQLALFRTTTASSAGSSVTARPYDGADSAFGGVIRTIPTKGTEGVQLLQARLWLTNTIAANPNTWEWVARPDQKPLIIGPAVTDGVALKIITGIATSTVDITLEFTSTSYL